MAKVIGQKEFEPWQSGSEVGTPTLKPVFQNKMSAEEGNEETKTEAKLPESQKGRKQAFPNSSAQVTVGKIFCKWSDSTHLLCKP